MVNIISSDIVYLIFLNLKVIILYIKNLYYIIST